MEIDRKNKARDNVEMAALNLGDTAFLFKMDNSSKHNETINELLAMKNTIDNWLIKNRHLFE